MPKEWKQYRCGRSPPKWAVAPPLCSALGRRVPEAFGRLAAGPAEDRLPQQGLNFAASVDDQYFSVPDVARRQYRSLAGDDARRYQWPRTGYRRNARHLEHSLRLRPRICCRRDRRTGCEPAFWSGPRGMDKESRTPYPRASRKRKVSNLCSGREGRKKPTRPSYGRARVLPRARPHLERNRNANIGSGPQTHKTSGVASAKKRKAKRRKVSVAASASKDSS